MSLTNNPNNKLISSSVNANKEGIVHDELLGEESSVRPDGSVKDGLTVGTHVQGVGACHSQKVLIQ